MSAPRANSRDGAPGAATPTRPTTGRSGTAWRMTAGIRCAFRVEKKQLNGARNVHGGCFMSFADYCLFATAAPVLQRQGVTLSFAWEFLAAPREGELIEGRAEIPRAGNSIIFLRGMLTSAEKPVFSFSGSIKRVARKVPQPANT